MYFNLLGGLGCFKLTVRFGVFQYTGLCVVSLWTKRLGYLNGMEGLVCFNGMEYWGGSFEFVVSLFQLN